MATYTVGSGGDYTTKAAFVTAYNAGTVVGTVAEDVIAEQIADLADGDTTAFTNTQANSLVWRSSAGQKWKITRSTNATAFIFNGNGVDITIEDIEIDANGLTTDVTTSGLIKIIATSTDLTINRCKLHNLVDTTRRLGFIGAFQVTSGTTTLNDCVLYNGVSGRNDNNAIIVFQNGANTVNINNCVIDDMESTDASASLYIAREVSGTATLNISNSSISRIVAPITTAIATGVVPTLTTNATWNTEGTVQNIDETEYVDANNGDFTLSTSSQLINAGTDLGNVVAAIDYSGFNRHTDSSRDPWDIGILEFLSDNVTRYRPLASGRGRLAPALVGRSV